MLVIVLRMIFLALVINHTRHVLWRYDDSIKPTYEEGSSLLANLGLEVQVSAWSSGLFSARALSSMLPIYAGRFRIASYVMLSNLAHDFRRRVTNSQANIQPLISQEYNRSRC